MPKPLNGPNLWYKDYPCLRSISKQYGNKRLNFEFLETVLFVDNQTVERWLSERRALTILLSKIVDVTVNKPFDVTGVKREIIDSWPGLLMGAIARANQRLEDISAEMDRLQTAIEEWMDLERNIASTTKTTVPPLQ